MIIVTERIETVPGRMSKGLDWADRIFKACETADLIGQKQWILRNLTSNPNIFSFVTQCATMGEWEEVIKKRSADLGISALLQEMGEAGWCCGVERIISQAVTES